MRTSKYILSLGLCILFALVASNSKAQFIDAVVPDTAVGLNPIFANNTGNDILSFGGSFYAVNVWDDNNGVNAGMSWKVGIWDGFINIGGGQDAVDPDVVLVKNTGGVVFAIVAYYSPNTNEFKCEVFQYSVAGHVFFNINTMVLANGMYNTAINIDANDIGDFVIVWDEPGFSVNCVTGTTNPTPALSAGGQVLTLDAGKTPDVSIFRNPTSGDNQADVVYITSLGKINVDFYRIDDLQNSVVLATPSFRSPNADLQYRYPRIATPNSLYGTNNDFTVVTEDTDGASSWYIKVFNSNGCCVPMTHLMIYNDGTTMNSPFNTSDQPNTRPVVCYEKGYTNIWVVWNLDNLTGALPAPGAAFAKSPVVLIGSKQGQLNVPQNYRYVPLSVVTGSNYNHVSLAGRNTTKNLLTYYKANDNSIYSKAVNQLPMPSQLKSTGSTSLNNWLDQATMDDGDNGTVYTLDIVDLSGKIVRSFSSTADALKETVKAFKENAVTGIYLVTVRSKSGLVTYNGKFPVTGF